MAMGRPSSCPQATVALRDESDPHVPGPFEWHRVGEDSPNVPVIIVVQALAAAGHRIVYLSGRSEVCRRATSVWIAEHIGAPGEDLLMRARDDRRPDNIMKKELYRKRVAPGGTAGMRETLEELVIQTTRLLPTQQGPAGDGSVAARQFDAVLMSATREPAAARRCNAAKSSRSPGQRTSSPSMIVPGGRCSNTAARSRERHAGLGFAP
jgi:hypothetical protein